MNEGDGRRPMFCPCCGGTELYVRRAAQGGQQGMLAGLGELFHYASFDVVVCALCGRTELFIESSARQRLRGSVDWREVNPGQCVQPAGGAPPPLPPSADPAGPDPLDLAQPSGEADEPVRCLGCGQYLPAWQDRCPKCGWTYRENP